MNAGKAVPHFQLTQKCCSAVFRNWQKSNFKFFRKKNDQGYWETRGPSGKFWKYVKKLFESKSKEIEKNWKNKTFQAFFLLEKTANISNFPTIFGSSKTNFQYFKINYKSSINRWKKLKKVLEEICSTSVSPPPSTLIFLI